MVRPMSRVNLPNEVRAEQWTGVAATLLDYIDTLRTGEDGPFPGASMAALARFFRTVLDETGDATREKLRQIAQDQATKSVSGAVVALRDRADHTDTLRACRIPVLGLVGADDALTPPEETRAMMDLTPRGITAEIPGAGHLSCIENPDGFNRAILGWLAEG